MILPAFRKKVWDVLARIRSNEEQPSECDLKTGVDGLGVRTVFSAM